MASARDLLQGAPRALAARWLAWRTRPLPPERAEWSPRRLAVLVLLVAVFIAGTVLFTQLQQQQLFKDANYELLEGIAPRNDGGILFGAAVMATSFTLLLAVFASPRSPHRMLKLLAGLVSFAALLVVHLSIFVNGVILRDTGDAFFTASFLYHDAASLNLVAIFLITLVTLLLGVMFLLPAYSLLYPRGFRRHVSARGSPFAARGVAQVTAFATVLPLVFFSAIFFHAGLTSDEIGAQGFFTTNVILLFYLVVATLLLLALLVAARTAYTSWHPASASGDDARRANQALAVIETWVLPVVVLLLALIALVPRDVLLLPVQGNRVFATNARGAVSFLALVLVPYAVNRRATRQLSLTAGARRPGAAERRSERRHAIAQAGTYLLLLPALVLSDGAPITVAATVLAVSGALFLLHSLTFRLEENVPRLLVRSESALPHFLAAVLLLGVSGLMLWGIGNTVEGVYAREGGFIRLGGSELQPFATLFKFLGAALLAVPLTIGLALKVTGGPARFGPLVLVPFAVIVGMTLYLSVSTETLYNSDLAATDIRVGFAQIGLTVTDTVALTLGWASLSAIVLFSLAWLLHRTQDLAPAPVRAPALPVHAP